MQRLNFAGRRAVAAVTLVGALGLAAGCGSSNDSTSSTPASGAITTASTVPSAVTNRMKELYAGTMTKPAPGPAAVRGKKVFFIPFSLQSPFGIAAAKTAQTAAKQLGWTVTVFDGRFIPATEATGIRQAIAQKVDGIAMYAIDCPSVKGAVAQAVKAGIKVVSGSGHDCSPPLFASEERNSNGDVDASDQAIGAAKADWIITKTQGAGVVLDWVIKGGSVSNDKVDQGFKDEIKAQCPKCKIIDISYDATVIGAALKQQASQALLQHPDANAIVVPFDDAVVNGIGAALVGSGRNDKVWVIGSGASDPALTLIRENKGLDATLGTDATIQGGYGPMDALNRAFAGKPAGSDGLGVLLIDKDHNLPASGSWKNPIDAPAAFNAIWSGQTP